MTLLARVALIDRTGSIDNKELTRVAAAIGVQAQRDLAQFWPVSATVSTLPDDGHLPSGVWPVYIVPAIAGAGGFHKSQHNQPFAEVAAGDSWSLAASHEILEMLVDPSGDRLVSSAAISVVDDQVQEAPGKFDYLVEVCDPSESPDHAYLIDDVVVSDFYTPRFFDPTAGPGVRYSFTGGITAPRQVLMGGYLSWWNGERGLLQQLLHVQPDLPPSIVDIGTQPPGGSLREFVNSNTGTIAALSNVSARHPIIRRRSTRTESLDRAAGMRAALFALPSAAVSFATHVRPLFTAAQVECMSGLDVNLDDYGYMSNSAGDASHPDHANARHVYARLAGSSEGRRMPEGGPYWTEPMLNTFRQWMDGGFAP